MYPLYRIIVAIIRKDGQLLIVNNQSGQEKRWSLPGGQIEAGETLEQALHREVAEETGLIVTAASFAFLTENFMPTHQAHSLVTYFDCEVSGVLDPNDPDEEIVETKWINQRELTEYITSEDVRLPLCTYLTEQHKGYYMFEEMKW
ncbi:NUDIX domain-containing protein [Exiguobacterium acetylicum]|uniref:NUDIX domain-containing protein n=1 Tax=Exiguobacterium acetylicum TaxID=41170 RepID=UPI001EE2E63D|nr:NUDIX hydrolase [Exiguobacterium acetylicum]UKS56359.1 NUDIX hydrolase [Exiguobacterium acetylicum]